MALLSTARSLFLYLSQLGLAQNTSVLTLTRTCTHSPPSTPTKIFIFLSRIPFFKLIPLSHLIFSFPSLFFFFLFITHSSLIYHFFTSNTKWPPLPHLLQTPLSGTPRLSSSTEVRTGSSLTTLSRTFPSPPTVSAPLLRPSTLLVMPYVLSASFFW